MLYFMGVFSGVAFILLGIAGIMWADHISDGRLITWCEESFLRSALVLIAWPLFVAFVVVRFVELPAGRS